MLPDPLTGRWTLDSGASQFSTRSPLAWILNVSADETGMTVEEDLTQSDGTAIRVTFAPRFDGRNYPVQGSPIMDSIAFVRRSERLLEASARRAGAISMRDTTEVSEDGHTLTISFSVFGGEQTVATGRAVFRRLNSG